MIESNLVIADITKREPFLAKIYDTGQTDWTNHFEDALTELIEDVRSMNFNVRKLCKRLSLESSVTKTAAFTGTKSSEDVLQRIRVVINATAKVTSGTIVFTLQGTNDSSSETWTDVQTINVTATGITSALIDVIYKFYRINLTSMGDSTSITYSSYLIETTFERLHLYKTMQLIYRSLMALDGDVWAAKMKEYNDLYLNRLQVANFAYDEDDDGSIEDIEKNRNNTRVRLRP